MKNLVGVKTVRPVFGQTPFMTNFHFLSYCPVFLHSAFQYPEKENKTPEILGVEDLSQ